MLSKVEKVFSMSRSLSHSARTKHKYKSYRKSLGLAVENNADIFPDEIMIHFEGDIVSWGEFNKLSNRIVNHLKYVGVEKGDVVSIFMENRIETMAAITASVKIGAIVSMINTNLVGKTLASCITNVDSKFILFGEELIDSVRDVMSDLDEDGIIKYSYFSDQKRIHCPEWAVVICQHFAGHQITLLSAFLRNLRVTNSHS